MTTPTTLGPHKGDYQNGSWRNYSPVELAGWAHLLSTRAQNRNPADTGKIAKDLYDAQNYIDMLIAATQEMDTGKTPGKLRDISAVFNTTSNFNATEARKALSAVQKTFSEALQAAPDEAVQKFQDMRRRSAARRFVQPALKNL